MDETQPPSDDGPKRGRGRPAIGPAHPVRLSAAEHQTACELDPSGKLAAGVRAAIQLVELVGSQRVQELLRVAAGDDKLVQALRDGLDSVLRGETGKRKR